MNKNHGIGNISIENCQIGFRNFSGKEGKFNKEGNRNFTIFLDEDIAEQLTSAGWNVKLLKPRDDEDSPKPILQVTVSFGQRPPNIQIIGTNNKRSRLNEMNVGNLDWAEIESVDVTISPYHWTMSGNSGIKAYLKSMYVHLVIDDLEKKYEVVPDSAIDTIGGCGECEVCDGGCNRGGVSF